MMPARDADTVRTLVRHKVEDAFHLANRGDPRAFDSTMSMSRLGSCTRQGAYRISDTPWDAEYLPLGDDKRPAWLGTWVHRGFLPLMRRVMRRSHTETPVTLSASGLTIPGRVDQWWDDIVLDLKTKSAHGVERTRKHGPRDSEWHQVRGYAAGLVQSRGATIRWLVLVVMDRSGGDSEVFVRPYGPAEAEAVMDRVHDLVLAAKEPDMAERDERGPGLSIACDGCPWLRRCWGEDAEPGVTGVQKQLATDPSRVAAALVLYDDARGREKQAKEDKEFARLVLDEQPPGSYGDLVLTWKRGSKGGSIAKAQAWDALVDAGVDLQRIADIAGVDLPRTSGSRPAIEVTHRGELE